MKKVTKAVTIVGLGLGLALGGNVAVAQAAEAASYYTQTQYVAPGLCEVRQYVNYDWWEEMWGNRDYSYHLYYTSCPSTNWYPA